MNIYEYISQKQIATIIETIKNRCSQFAQMEKQYKNFFYEPYCKMRKKHNLTLSVLSAFSPTSINIEGFTIKDEYYGLNNKMAQPELHSEKAIIQIYSNGSDLNNKSIKTKCELYNQNNNFPIFFIIKFTVDTKNILKSIDICLFDSMATITQIINIYNNPILMSKTA